MWWYSMQTISQEQWIIQWNHRKICLNFHYRIPEPISMSLKILCMVTELPLLHLITESSPPKYISMLFVIKLAQIFSLDWFCWKILFFLKWKYFSFVNFCCRISRTSFTCFVKQDSKSPCPQLCGRLQTNQQDLANEPKRIPGTCCDVSSSPQGLAGLVNFETVCFQTVLEMEFSI